jgi:hypothetical protein
MPPTNDAPNPYRTVEGFFKMPAGRVWGSLSAVDIDKDGSSIWVAERCGVNDCVGSQLDPVLLFDKNGNLVRSFGAGLIRSPHGIHVDKDNNIWIIDCSCTGAGSGGRAGGGGRGGAGGGGRGGAGGRGGPDSTLAVNRGAPPGTPAVAVAPAPGPGPMTNGHQIFKFSPTGQILMVLGKPAGDSTQAGMGFWQPNDVATAPNGDIYVAEGHSDAQKVAVGRIRKLDKTGKQLAVWGTVQDTSKRDEPHQFGQPHALAFDSKGRLFVGDRSYNRIKIFDQTGKLLDTWYQFSRPSGIFIDAADNIYVADSESGSINPPHVAWKRGIRMGKISDGKVTAFIPDPQEWCAGRTSTPAAPCATGTLAEEGVAVDKAGNVYGAQVGPRKLQRYEKKP